MIIVGATIAGLLVGFILGVVVRETEPKWVDPWAELDEVDKG